MADAFDQVARNIAKATTAAMAGAAEGAKKDLRDQLKASGFKFSAAANAIRSQHYPNRAGKASPNAAATVWAAGDSAERWLSAFAQGATITPKKGRFLAIPLHNFRDAQRRLIGPRSSFWGGKLVFVPTRGTRSIGVLAQKQDAHTTGRAFGRNSRKRRAFSRQAAADLIPQFALVRVVTLRRLLTPEQVMLKWTARLPELVQRASEVIGVR